MDRRNYYKRDNRKLRKRHRKKVPFYKKFFSMLIFCIIIGLLIFFIDKVFSVKKIEISGNDKVSREIILKKLEVFNKNILFIKKNDIENNLLNDKIKAVKVEKKMPDTLNISIVENRNVAYIKESEDNYYFINVDGFVEGKTKEEPKNIPIIYGVSLEPLHDGVSIFQDENIKFIFEKIEEYGITIIEYDFSDTDNIVIKTEEINIFLGDINNLTEKIDKLNDILTRVGTDNINIKEINIKEIKNPIISE
ncbi:cell division protein FtsQ/DivIB [Miniphocaeibacter massiliensis]|uniref:cell division protein FtsQ/DivIB n=1 Tax=Miniphocaeibacter massiliensis TaxID=2041841 RepID=UPI000C080E27|nr:FtsQ-type POTRA domain-containing protein [Miniphocaeibacter massiliensis]